MSTKCANCGGELGDDPNNHHAVSLGKCITLKSRSIKIVSVPGGEAPAEIRKAWVGLEIPLFERFRGVVDGVLSKTRMSGIKKCYSVSTSEAIKLLREKSPEAAQWWEKNYPPSENPRLLFLRSSCRIVS